MSGIAMTSFHGASVAGISLGPSVLISGLFTGLIYGLLAISLVLVYRASRFINFAGTATGVFGAGVTGALFISAHVPYWVAFAAGVIVAAAVSALIEAGFIRRLRNAPRVLGMVVTLGLAEFLLILELIINSNGASGSTFPLPAGFKDWHLSSSNIVSAAYVAMLVLTPFVLLALALFLRKSRYGLAIRAASDNPDAASLAGVTASRMVTLSWAIAGAIAGFSAILYYPNAGLITPDSLGPDLLLKGLAGAVIGRMRSLPIAFAASLGIGVGEQLLLSRTGATSGQVDVVLFIVILIGLLAQPVLGRRDEENADWSRLNAPPLPSAYNRIFLIRRFGWIVGIPALVVVGWLAWVVTNSTAATLTTVVGIAIVGLSVGLLTGQAGQLSLGQLAFAGIGGATTAAVAILTTNVFVGLVAGCAASAVAAVIVGLPALRLKGLAFAVSTLAFALAATNWLLRQEWQFGKEGIPPDPITLGGWGVTLSAKDFYLFAVILMVVALYLAYNLRRGGFGRLLRAMRDNEDAARAFGIAAPLRKLQLFAAGGVIAGLGGAVIALGQSTATYGNFVFTDNITVVAVTAVGGLGSLIGPLLGAAYLKGLPLYFNLGSKAIGLLVLGWLILLIVYPRGFAGILVSIRNKIADGVARVRGIDPRQARLDDVGGSADRAMQAVDLAPLVASRAADAKSAAPVAPTYTLAGDYAAAPLLSVRGLSRSFGGVQAVRGVDLDVYRGEILGIIGPNGAGKTTLFEIIAGFTKPDAGTVTFESHNVTRMTPEARAKLGLVRSFQAARLYPTMTVLDTVMVALERRRPTHILLDAVGFQPDTKRKDKEARELIEVMGLTPLIHRPVGELSTGTRRMVELTCMLALDPKMLLLDEPAGGIAQSEGEALVELLTAVRRDLGTTLVVVEHDLPLLFRLADRVVAMELGAVIASGTAEEVRNHPDVVRSYLGGDMVAVERSGPFVAGGAAAAPAAAPAAATMVMERPDVAASGATLPPPAGEPILLPPPDGVPVYLPPPPGFGAEAAPAAPAAAAPAPPAAPAPAAPAPIPAAQPWLQPSPTERVAPPTHATPPPTYAAPVPPVVPPIPSTYAPPPGPPAAPVYAPPVQQAPPVPPAPPTYIPPAMGGYTPPPQAAAHTILPGYAPPPPPPRIDPALYDDTDDQA